MVAVVSGNGLGLFNSSLTQLGAGLGGQSSIGQGRDAQHVNIATGNLLLTGRDESLFGRGLSTGLVRTYNSAGSFGEAGDDGWQTGYERTVRLASGPNTLNTAGSWVERATADGAIVRFDWNATRLAYVSSVGDGAHDTIVLSGTGTDARWLWTEGSSQTQETYAAGTTPTVAGRLERIADLATGAAYQLTYNANNRLEKITGANGETLEFTYDAITGALTALSTRERNAAGALVLKGQVTYGYDAANRLSWVQTDLTPDVDTDNGWDAATLVNNDGKRFRTSYTYADASSLRITGVNTSDGVSISYAYDGSGRIQSLTQGHASDGSAQTLTYTYNVGATDVTDSAGRTWTYQYDGDGQLTAVVAPAVNGQRQVTNYSYDADGNLTRMSQAGYVGAAATLDTVFAYDGNGNLLLQRDRLGNTVQRTYNAANRVLTEASYSTPDADGLDPTFIGTSNLPAGALVSRYVYDASNLNQLRFVLNAAGEVSESQYFSSGPASGQQSVSRRFLGASYDTSGLAPTAVPTLAQMTAWIVGKEGQTGRADVSYDAQGRIMQTVAYATVDSNGAGVLDAAAAITNYSYDAQGLLRQKIAVYGASRTLGGAAPTGSAVTDYLYDGLGRLLGVINRDVATAINDDPSSVSTTYSYLDAANQLQVTLDSGAVRIEARNKAGLLLSVSESDAVIGATITRTTQNFYDAAGRLRASQDANEARSYFFYDAAGRLTATVDATGAVTETRYDEIGRAVQTVGYSTLVNTSAWLSAGAVTIDTLVYADTQPSLSAGQAWVDLSAASDRNAYRSYDAAGRLATETDAAGLVTTYAYDGASRLLSTTVSKPTDGTVTPRVTRYFYDAAGRLVGTLDAAGYLTESVFDAGGRLVMTLRYASSTDVSLHVSGTLAELHASAAAGPLAAGDQRTRYFYDGRGQQVGVLNAEGYLTESVTDETAGLINGTANLRAVKAYALQLTDLSGDKSFGELRTSALAGAVRLTERRFNGLGQLITERNAEDTVTKYSYDEAGRLVRTESAHNTSEVRENFARYDVFGQLIGELSGQQAADAMDFFGVASINDLNEEQRDAAYSTYGTTHSYDLRGQRIESIDAKGTDPLNLQGNKTWYFYDDNGRNTFTVRGVADANGIKNARGEVTETRYTAFGQVQDSIAYTGAITLLTPDDRASVQSAVTTLSIAGAQSRRQFGYDQRGLLTRVTDAENVVSNTIYNAFGQVHQEQRAVNTSAAVTIEHNYDQRGLEIGRIEGTVIPRSSSQVVDAFGRVISITDARGNIRTFAYDRLGRQISRTQAVEGEGRTELWQSSYDAYSQVVSQIDALGRTTTYAISDSNRTVTITTPELIVTTSAHNRFGQTVTATDGNGASTSYTYDKNGALLETTNALGQVSRNGYDDRGLLERTIDASGHVVEYRYDAVGRLLTRIEDPAGLALTTTTSYDGQGRRLTVTDASGRETRISYDREGRVLSQAHDPNGLNLRTNYTWDAAGRQLTVVEAAGTTVTRTTEYIYDELGRRTKQITDPGTLKLTTTYAYDANDNVVGSIDATGNLTRFAYDEANRLRFSVDALGGVTETAYDANGRVTMTRQYVKPISLSGLPTAAPRATLSNLVSNDALDLITYRVYDRNGRVRATIDGLGDVTLLTYDGANNVTGSTRYVNAVTLTPEMITSILAGTASAEDILDLPDPGSNSGPEITNAIQDQSAVREQAFNLSFANTFSDPNGDILTYTYTKTGTADWLVFDANARTFSGTPSSTDGNVTIRLTATDPAGLSVSEDFVITLTTAGGGNVGPEIANAIDDQTAVREQAFNLSFANTFSDPNGDILTYTYTKTGTADWLVFDADARTFSGTPSSTDGNVTIRLTATDPAGLSVSEDFVITLTTAGGGNVGPVVANAIDDQTAVKQQPFSFTFPANTFFDANGDDLTYSYTKLVGTAFWLSFNANTRTFSGQPSNFANNVTIRLTATDPAGMSVYEDFVIAVVSSTQFAPTSPEASSTQTTMAAESDLALADTTLAQTSSSSADQVTSFAYDAAGRVVRQTDGTGAVTRYVHDAAGRTVYTIDPLGNYTRNWFDQAGRLCATRQYAAPLDTADLSDASTVADLDLMVVTNIVDQGNYFVYDANGKLRYALDLAGTLTESTHDSAGRQVSSRTYVTAVVVDSTLANKLLAGTAAGSLSAPVANDSADRASYSIYNELGQVRMRVDGAGNVVAVTYDAAGRVITEKRFAQAANISTLRADLKAGIATIDQLTPNSVATDQMVYHVYDAAGRLRYTINSLGHTSEMLYDAAGRQVSQRSYANAIDLAAKPALVAAMKAGTATLDGPGSVAAALSADAKRDRQSYVVFDGAGQSRFAVDVLDDGLGAVIETRHDAAGRVTEQLAYATRITFSADDKIALAEGKYSAATLADAVRTQEPSARKSQSVYDAAGQLVYSLTRSDASQAVVSERRYDAAGRVIAQINYGITLSYDPTRNPSGVEDAIEAAQGDLPANQRLTRYVYDAAGHLRFSIDDAGAVSEQIYDALGQVTSTRLYATPIVITDPTADSVADAVAGQTGVRQTKYTYDNAGRLKTVTDNLNQVESYSYDALGQRTSRVDKRGYTWTTAYDAAGRVIKETSPPVDVASVDNAGVVTVPPTPRAIVTKTAYDALGNVISRTEDATGAKPRVTKYEYDSAGRQVRTVFPDAGVVNASGALVASTGPTPETLVIYDALGRAVVQKDVLGNYSYKVYDLQGRVAYDIDPEGYVTRNVYNALGEQTTLTRFANKLVTSGTAFTGAGWDPGEAITLAQAQAGATTNAADRVLTNSYDLRGNKTSVKQTAIDYYDVNGVLRSGASAASPETRFVYDAFGQIVKESVLIDFANSVWADTVHYFDDLGRETMTVDAEGYVSTKRYDAMGQVTTVTEYARAINIGNLSTAIPPSLPMGGDVTIGFDRVSRFTYDALGRKASESVQRSFTKTDGSIGVRDVATTLTYDAADHLLTSTVDGVLTTTLAYDALGRTASVKEAERDVLRANVETQLQGSTSTDLDDAAVYERRSPFTAIAYDAFGNAVRQTRYANGVLGSGAPTADPTRDQVTVTRYDWQGRAVMTVDAVGSKTYSNYNAADQISHQWHALRGSSTATDAVVHHYFNYDKTGQQTETRVERAVGAAAAVVERRQFASYNAFGEIVAQGVALADLGNAAKSIQSSYNVAGNLVASNGTSGATRTFGYNLAGFQVREQRYVSQLNGSTPVTWLETYRQVSDRLGRVVQTVLPSHTSDESASTSVLRSFDRWGNVLEEVDPRGYRTRSEYNEQNQKTRQIAPQVEVVGEDGLVRWQSPETRWMYDALGRLTATRDANGHVDQNVYNAAGQVIRTVDGTGAVTLQGYDALGNARVKQNPVGYLTWQAFDRAGRVTAHGDYLPDLTGTVREKEDLEQYTLNQDGQRVIVIDAMEAQTKYDYDSDGQLLHSKSAMNVVMDYNYDLQGRKIREANGLGDFQTWNYDVFGRLAADGSVVAHRDLGAKTYTYSYDALSGQLTNETSQWGANRTTAYYANGQVRQLKEGNNWYIYQYDANGNRTYEETLTVDGGGLAIRQRSRSTYDSHNRLVRVIGEELNTTTGVPFKVIVDVKYGYDAVGNRRVVVADSAYGTGVTAPTTTNLPPKVIGTPDSRSVRTGFTTLIRLRPADVFQDPEQFPLVYSTTLPAGITVSYDELASTGELVFTVASAATAGAKTIRLTATDASGASSFVNFTVTVAANAVPVTTGTGDTVIDLITGAAFATELPVSTYFKDTNAGDVLTYSVATVSPAAAWLQLDTSTPGTLRLSGTPTSAGTYTLTLSATDGTGVSAQRTIQIKVAANATPVVAAGTIPTQVALIGRDFIFDWTRDELFTDANADDLALTATLTGGAPLPAWFNLQVLNNTNPPTVRFVGFVPSDATAQTFGVVITAKDPSGASVSRTVNVQLIVDPGELALINPIPDRAAPATGLAWTYVIPTGTFVSSNDTPLTYSASGLPSWLSFNTSTGTFSGTPAPIGTWTITVTAIGGPDDSVSDTFTITTVNVAPVLKLPLSGQNAPLDTAWSYTVPAGTFVDYNNQNLTYTATGMPPGVSFNAGTQTFSGKPSAAGLYMITITASDGSLTRTGTFNVAVNTPGNQPPVVVNGLSDQYALTQDAFYYQIPANAFSDPEGTTLTYSATLSNGSALPTWLTCSTNGLFSGNTSAMAKVLTIQVRATDANGGWATDDFTLTIEDGGGGGTQQLTMTSKGDGNRAKKGGGKPTDGINALVATLPAGTLQQSWGVTAVTAATAYAVGNTSSTTRNYELSWYTYDGENRTVVSNGTLVGGLILADNYKSYEQKYDAAGNHTLTLRYYIVAGNGSPSTTIDRSEYTLRGQVSRQYFRQTLGELEARGVMLNNTYDAAGRLLEARQYFENASTRQYTDAEGISMILRVGGWLSSADIYKYDADGRMLEQLTIDRGPTDDWVAAAGRGSDDDTTIAQQKTELFVLTSLRSSVDYSQSGITRGYDSIGRVQGYSYYQRASYGQREFTFDYKYQYQARDSYLELAITGTSPDDYYRATTSDSIYDAYGRRTSVTEHTRIEDAPDLYVKRYFAHDAASGILSRRDGNLIDNVFVQAREEGSTKLTNPTPQWITSATWNAYSKVQREAVVAQSKNQRFVYANGQMIASVNQAGGALDARSRLTAYQTSETGSGGVTVQAGDTLESIAQRVYGNSSLWYVLASANAIETDSQLVSGTELKVPNVKVSQNDASTFKPYDPGQVIGPTAPGLPYIEPPKACNPIAMLIMVVVAIVATIFTCGAALAVIAPGMTMLTAGLGSAMLAGAIGGMAGSIASQVVGKALGVVDHFSLRSVVAGGITGALTAGIGNVAGFQSVGAAMKAATSVADYARVGLQAVALASAGYVGNRIAGIKDTHFSWKAIAASAVTSIVTAGIGNGLAKTDAFANLDPMVQDFATGMAGGVVGLHVRRAFGFDDKVNYGQIALDAFGNALGNALGQRLSAAASNRSQRLKMGLTKNQFNEYQQLGQFEQSIYDVSGLDGELDHEQRMSTAVDAGATPQFALAANTPRTIFDLLSGVPETRQEAGSLFGFSNDESLTCSIGEQFFDGARIGDAALTTYSGEPADANIEIEASKIAGWRAGFSALRLPVGFDYQGPRLSHNTLLDFGQTAVDAYELVMSTGSDSADVIADLRMALRSSDAQEHPFMKLAGATPRDLVGLSESGIRQRLADGMTASINNVLNFAEKTQTAARFGSNQGEYFLPAEYLKLSVDGVGRLGRTSLLGDAATFIPFGVGQVSAAGQIVALDNDRQMMDAMRGMGMVSIPAHQRFISDTGWEQTNSAISVVIGGFGKLGKTGQVLTTYGTTVSDAEAARTLGRSSRAITAGNRGRAVAGVVQDDLADVILRRHRAGNEQVEINGRRYNIAPGGDLSKLRGSDAVGDAMQKAANRVAAKWTPEMMSEKYHAAVDRATQRGNLRGATLLQRRAQGQYVHTQLQNQFHGKDGITYNSQGVDFTSNKGPSYEVTSKVESSLDTHALRMSNITYRFITYTPYGL